MANQRLICRTKQSHRSLPIALGSDRVDEYYDVLFPIDSFLVCMLSGCRETDRNWFVIVQGQ